MAIDKLVQIMACLRDREHGCPWDLKQTTQSLTRYTLEEVYEVVDAIENGTTDKLKDELGDLLFQVVFYSRIAEESNQFEFGDVAEAISAKLLRRHPHVFPDGTLASFGQSHSIDADQVVSNWEAIKKQEREQADTGKGAVSVLADVPTALPSLKRAMKLQKRAANVGFDWNDACEVLTKLKEELHELEVELNQGDEAAIEEEVGDVLFAIVNLARHLNVEPETALRKANRKFVRRFEFIESSVAERGGSLEEEELDTLEGLWNEAKQNGL